jgi:translation initiation factor 2 alpha subunit (eIF-2alpha)
LARVFGHAYEGFKLAIVEPDKVFSHLPDLPADLKDQLLKEILERLTPQAVRVRADVEVTCFAYEGSVNRDCARSTIDAIFFLFLTPHSFNSHT